MNLSFTTWAKNAVERAAVSFGQAVVALVTFAGLSDFDISTAKALVTAGLVGAAAAIKSTLLPTQGFGWSPFIDMLSRAGWTFVQTAAVTIVAASATFDAFSASAWQVVWVSAGAAALSVFKSWVAERAVPDTLTPASLAPAGPVRDAA